MLHAFLSQQPFSVADSRQLHPPSANDKIIKGAQSTPCLRLIQLLAVPFFNIHIFTRFQMTSSMQFASACLHGLIAVCPRLFNFLHKGELSVILPWYLYLSLIALWVPLSIKEARQLQVRVNTV